MYSISHERETPAYVQSRMVGSEGNNIMQVDRTFGLGAAAASSQWIYGYNTAGEVALQQKKVFQSTGSYVFVNELNRSFGYDGAGNFYPLDIGAGVGGAGNEVNQVTQIKNTDKVQIFGMAPEGADVGVEGSVRRGTWFAGQVVNTQSDPFTPQRREAPVTVPSLGFSATGHAYIPPRTENLAYDDDGYLTGDGRWEYRWDAENRLVGLATKASAVSVGVPGADAIHRVLL